MWSIRTQDLYKAVVTEVSGIASSGDVNFTVSTPPSRTNGFLVLSPDNALNRETVYFHNVIGSRIYVRWVNRKNPKAHSLNDLIQMNDVEEIFNYYADMTSPLFYVEKTGSLNVLVWWGTVLVNRTQVTVADTALALTDNTTNYIVYDYLTNVISVNTTGVGLVKATVVTASGIITSITYNVIKESYADPYVPDLALVAPEVQKQTWVYALATGAVNTYAITLTPAPTAYAVWQKFTFKANLANTGTATLNVNGLGAKTIKKLGGTTNLASGDIAINHMVEVEYNGTDFDMQSQVASVFQLDINWQTEKVAPVWWDFLLLSDSEASFVNKKVKRSALPFYYWDGSDGSVTVSTTISLTRDMQYSSLTITWAWTINTRWYKIFVSWTLTNSWTIQILHWNWGNAVLNVAWVAAVSSDTWSLWNIQLWWDWAAWKSNQALSDGTNTSTPVSVLAPLSSTSSSWGSGWRIFDGAVWRNPWTSIAWANTKYIWELTNLLSLQINNLTSSFYIPSIQYSRSCWGGWAWAWSTGISWGGWAAWNGGWCIFISAKTIINNATIKIIWWNWWIWWNASANATNARMDWWGGGWAGGSGWIIFLLTSSLTWSWTVQSSWWNWNNWWNASNNWWAQWADGGGGWNGWNGWIIISPTWNTFVVSWWTFWTWWTWVWFWVTWASGSAWVSGITINY